MSNYRIDQFGATLHIEVAAEAPGQAQLLDALRACQEGQCSCPTTEYTKLASSAIVRNGATVRLQLNARAGEQFDVAEVENCLRFTLAQQNGGETR